jgi:arylsulfatase A-like enzyme
MSARRTPTLLSAAVFSVAAAAAAQTGTAQSSAAPGKPNVLFVVSDDLNNDLGAYGAKVHSPAIDALAARGVRFDRAYTQYPLCSPSRSSFLTGRRPDATGVLTNPSNARPFSPHFRERLPDAVTLPQLFKNNGWFAARIGKLYHYGVPNHIGTSSLDDYPSWDLAINPRGHDREIHDRIFTIGRPGQFGATLSWWGDDVPGEQHTDGIAASEAVRLLERFARERRPFFLAVGLYRPHTPYVAPRKYFDLYPPDGIELPRPSDDDKARTPAAAYASAQKVQDALEDRLRREAIQAYRASITFMDAQVGVMLSALERLGLSQNTIVVFTSDHGYHLGDHGLWQKMSLFERSARVPLLIAAPGAPGNGRAAGGVVELLDLYRTLADLAGLTPNTDIEGTSLRPMLDDPRVTVKPYAFTKVRAGYAVRSERWRYVEWSGGEAGAQLYDMERDPGETRNLAADPAGSGTRRGGCGAQEGDRGVSCGCAKAVAVGPRTTATVRPAVSLSVHASFAESEILFTGCQARRMWRSGWSSASCKRSGRENTDAGTA